MSTRPPLPTPGERGSDWARDTARPTERPPTPPRPGDIARIAKVIQACDCKHLCRESEHKSEGRPTVHVFRCQRCGTRHLYHGISGEASLEAVSRSLAAPAAADARVGGAGRDAP